MVVVKLSAFIMVAQRGETGNRPLTRKLPTQTSHLPPTNRFHILQQKLNLAFMKMIYYYLIKLLFILKIETETVRLLELLHETSFCISLSTSSVSSLLFHFKKNYENLTIHTE